MNDAATAKWLLFDLLKALDIIHDGQYHDVFARIAEGANLVLPAPPPPPDPVPAIADEAAGEPSDPTPCLKPEADSETDTEASPETDSGANSGADSGGVPAARRGSEQDRVYQFLSAQAGPVALARIVAELGIKRWTVNSTLYRLLKKGSIEHSGRDAWQVRSAG